MVYEHSKCAIQERNPRDMKLKALLGPLHHRRPPSLPEI